MPQLRIPAIFMRGGTSKAVVFHARDLPAYRAQWDAIFLAALGSPDPNGRQLDGLGGGLSSLSKVCVVGPPSRPDADIDYTFAQIGVGDASVDYSGNCGNMSSAMGPFALDEGLVSRPANGDEAVVRIHNTNTGKIIVARFPLDGEEAAVEGDMALDGVSGTGASVRLEFLDPGGAKTGRLLPTGRAADTLDVPGLGKVEASLVDAASPCVFVAAESVEQTGVEMPADLERDARLLAALEGIRRAASVAMGIADRPEKAAEIPSVPKVAFVSRPRAAMALSRRKLAAGDMEIAVRMISTGQPHRAVPLTGALCLAVATRIPGTIPQRLVRAREGAIRIAQPSGTTVVDAKVVPAPGSQGGVVAEHAAVYRTQRRLFEGAVLVRASAVPAAAVTSGRRFAS
jgi:hypothetical protein